jgi:hypothetical protein
VSEREERCIGSDGAPLDRTQEGVKGNVTAMCPVCQGRFKLRDDTLIPPHAPTPIEERAELPPWLRHPDRR